MSPNYHYFNEFLQFYIEGRKTQHNSCSRSGRDWRGWPGQAIRPVPGQINRPRFGFILKTQPGLYLQKGKRKKERKRK